MGLSLVVVNPSLKNKKEEQNGVNVQKKNCNKAHSP